MDATLRTALRANAAFSALSGLVLAAGSGVLGPWLGIPQATLVVVGVALLPWALLLHRSAARPAPSTAEARLAVAGDLAWVAGSAAVLLLDPIGLTTAGKVAVVVVALLVADFAVWQAIGLGRLRHAAGA
jgi:hypothetical protein